MDFQNRVGSKVGAGGVASASESNRQRRERLKALALETIDINKVPWRPAWCCAREPVVFRWRATTPAAAHATSPAPCALAEQRVRARLVLRCDGPRRLAAPNTTRSLTARPWGPRACVCARRRFL